MNVVLNSPQDFFTLKEARNAFLHKPARTGHDWHLPSIRGRMQKQVLRFEEGWERAALRWKGDENQWPSVTFSQVLRHKSWVRWHTPVIPALGRWDRRIRRSSGHSWLHSKSETSRGYIYYWMFTKRLHYLFYWELWLSLSSTQQCIDKKGQPGEKHTQCHTPGIGVCPRASCLAPKNLCFL